MSDDAEVIQRRIRWRRNLWFPLRYGLCLSEALWPSAFKNTSEVPPWPDNLATTVTWSDRCGDRHALVVMRADVAVRPATAFSLLAHEAVHLSWELVRTMGEKTPGEEFLAYTTQGFFTELMDDMSQYLSLTPVAP